MGGMTDVYCPLGKTADLSLIDSTSRRGQICYTPAFAFDSARAPWKSWLASINDLRILIDVEQLTIEHSRISLSAEAMP